MTHPASQHNAHDQRKYDPENLLNTVMARLNLKNDAALSRSLTVAPPLISKVRHRRLPVGASLLLRIHETTGMSIKELRELLGDRRARLRMSDAEGKRKTQAGEGGSPS
jgi:hypothetical protein